MAHQQLGAMAMPTNPTNGQTETITINGGTAITLTYVSALGSTPNSILIQGTAALTNVAKVNFLRRPDITNGNQIAATVGNQALLQYVGWALPTGSTTITPFSLDKNVNGASNNLTSFTASTTVTGASWTAQTMQLYVEDGTYYIGNTRYLFTGGSTPTFTAPVTYPRIDLVTANASGGIAVVTGTENASPSAPTYPTGVVVLAEVYHVVGETGLYDFENQQSGQGYVYNDVRNIVTQPFGAGIIDGAWFTDLAGIPAGAGLIPVANLPFNSFNSQSFTAARAVTKGKALILGTGISGYLTGNNQVGSSTVALNSSGSGDEVAQSFTTSANTTGIRAVMVKTTTNNAAGGSYGYVASIYAVNGSNQPTGAALGTSTASLAQNSTQTVTLTFSSPIAVSPNTTYCLVISSGSGGINGNTTTVYYDNAAGYNSATFSTTTNGGTSWTSSTTESLYYELWETMTVAGEVQESDTTQTVLSGDNYDLSNNFCGFALATVSSGATVGVNLGPVDSDQTGLTVGAEYYLNGSGGVIGTTAGAVSVKVGLSVSATQLLIKFNNYP